MQHFDKYIDSSNAIAPASHRLAVLLAANRYRRTVVSTRLGSPSVRWPNATTCGQWAQYQISTRAARSYCQRWAELFKLCTNYTLAKVEMRDTRHVPLVFALQFGFVWKVWAKNFSAFFYFFSVSSRSLAAAAAAWLFLLFGIVFVGFLCAGQSKLHFNT